MTSRKSTTFMFFGIIIGLCFGIVFRNYRTLELVTRCSLRPNPMQSPLDLIELPTEDTVSTSQNNLLFVGVMTSKDFLHDRAKAVYETWGREVPGRLAFFSSEGSYADGMPVVALKGVDDRYPPQKKSFRMLYYMYEHFIDRFEWFARADDDVYVNTHKLEKFLRSIDSSKPQFIGQAGRGNSEEFGLLSLEFDENFCMGGPGVIMSQETLKRIGPHIATCLKNLYSTHEDVEVGRCVQKFAGIPCTWNYEMQSILHHNSSGLNAFTGNLKSKEIHTAITLHPVKRPPLMYRLHSYMQGMRAQQMRQETLSLHRDIALMRELLTSDTSTTGEGRGLDNNYELDTRMKFENAEAEIFPSSDPRHPRFLGDHEVLGTRPHLNKAQLKSRRDLQVWEFISRSLYSSHHSNPKRKIESTMREALEDVITEIMDQINNFSRQRGRVIEFREILYGYSRVNSLYGHDLILDLLLIYKKYRGKKMTVPVRRHLYVQRAFTECYVREIADGKPFEDENFVTKHNSINAAASRVKDLLQSSINRISDDLFALPLANQTHDSPETSLERNTQSKAIAALPKIVFVLSLAGRFETFQRFLRNYEEICLKHPEMRTDFLLVLYSDSSSGGALPYLDELNILRSKYPLAALNCLTRTGNFSRGLALNAATYSRYIKSDDIIFFIDVDITFTRNSIERIRFNTLKHRQVYLPIVFSEYNKRGWQSDVPTSTKSPTPAPQWLDEAQLDFSAGYFRQFGYGICAIFKADILYPAINGFNTDITGWGLEDVRFLEKIVKMNVNATQAQRTATVMQYSPESKNVSLSAVPTMPSLYLEVFRAPDPSLVHIYHDIHCDKSLNDSQYSMCLGTKANTIGRYRYIESIFMRNQPIVEFAANQRKFS